MKHFTSNFWICCLVSIHLAAQPPAVSSPAPTAVAVPASTSTATTGTNSIAGIQRHLLREASRLYGAYVERNRGAKDEPVALNALLEAQQKLRQYNGMVKSLKRRYELFLTQPQVNKEALVDKTILPILQIHYQLGQVPQAQEFAEQLRTEWAGNPLLPELDQKMKALADKYEPPDVGDPVAVAFTDLVTGKQIDTAKLKGDVVLLHFWISTCDICKAQKKVIEASLETFGPLGFHAFGFPQDTDREKLKTFIKEQGYAWPQCFDQDAKHRFATRLKLIGVPTDFLIGRDGKVAAVNARGDQLFEKLNQIFDADNPKTGAPPTP